MKLVFCRQCGLLLPPGAFECPRCHRVSAETSAPDTVAAPPRYHDRHTPTHTTTGRYLWALCLFWLPLIGLVPLLIFAVGATGDEDLKHLAQAYLIRQVILSALLLAAAVLFVLGPRLSVLLALARQYGRL